MNSTEVNKNIEKLRQASTVAAQVNDFKRVVELASAASSLTDWLKGGMVGDPPVDADALLPEAAETRVVPTRAPVLAPQPVEVPREPAPRLERTVEPTQVIADATPLKAEPVILRDEESPQSMPIPAVSASQAQPPKASVGAALQTKLIDVQRKADGGNFSEALLDLELLQENLSEVEQVAVTEAVARIQAARNAKATDQLKAAKRIVSRQLNNLAAQRTAWEQLLKIEPDSREAAEALDNLAVRERQERQRTDIAEIRKPLQEELKDLKAVNEMRRRADQLRQSGEVKDPALREQLEETYKKLDDLRSDMQRAGEGGTSNVVSENFDQAIKTYTDALGKGYDTIKDDVSGEIVRTVDVLGRARLAYWTNLSKRVSERQNDANESLQAGYPDTAVSKLEEADVLVKKIQEGGENERSSVEKDLSRAREEQRNKKEAQRLVTEAMSDTDPEVARAKLVQAKTIYPKYPHLDEEYIKPKDVLVLNKAIQNMISDQSAAAAAMRRAWEQDTAEDGRREYDAAREFCRIALSRGANLSLTSSEQENRRQEIRKLLDTINQNEETFNRLMGHLRSIDQAVKAADGPLATSILAQLTDAEKSDRRVQALRIKTAQFKADDQKLVEAERLFFQDRNFTGVTDLCKTIESPQFRKEARELASRAQARLTLNKARNDYQSGDLAMAINGFQQVETLKSVLPMEDQVLSQEAETERKQTEQEQQRAAGLRQRLIDTSRLRQQANPAWSKWSQAIGALRNETPLWLRSELEKEYDAGKVVWLESAMLLAGRQEIRGELHRAYETLELLAKEGLVGESEPLWRRVQYAHFKSLTEDALAGTRLEDWDNAEGLAEKSRNSAPADGLRSANDFLNETIRLATLKRAALAATTSNLGPDGAIRILEEKTRQYPGLNMDAQIRARLLRYYMDKYDFVKASDQAQTMAYVYGEENWSTQWQQLVQASQAASKGNIGQTVGVLADLRLRLDDTASSALKEAMEYVLRKQLDQLMKKVRPDTLALTNEELVGQIQTLEYIRQIKPADQWAEQQLRALTKRLGGLVDPLKRQVDQISLHSGDSLIDTDQKARVLLGQIRAVLHALQMSGGLDNLVEPLRRTEERLTERVAEWQTAINALDQLRDRWAYAIGGTWDTKSLDESLDVARSVGDVKEITDWESKIGLLKECLDGTRRDTNAMGLRALVRSVMNAWQKEEFDQLIARNGHGLIDELRNKITRANSEIDKNFVIPQSDLTFKDDYSEPHRITNLDLLREVVTTKLRNFNQWDAWQTDYKTLAQKVNESWDKAIEIMAQVPPCLTSAKNLLDPMEESTQALKAKIQIQPKHALSDKASGIAEYYQPTVLDDQIEGLLVDRSRKLKILESELAKTEDILRRLTPFRKGTRPLTNQNNRRDLRRIIDDLRKIDACHPEITNFEPDLARFER